MGVLDRIMFKGSSERQSGKTQNEPIPAARTHFVTGHSLSAPFPDGVKQAVFGMGCFWGAEKTFWKCSGVYVTAVGYAGGSVRNVTYQEVCTGETGHAEVVLVVFNPNQVSFDELLSIFWGKSRSNTRDASRKRFWDAVPVGYFHRKCWTTAESRNFTSVVSGKSQKLRATARSQQRFARLLLFIMRNRITSSI